MLFFASSEGPPWLTSRKRTAHYFLSSPCYILPMASRSLRLLVLVALLAVLARSPHLGLVPRRGVSAAAAALWGGAPFAARCAWAEVALKEEAPLVQGRQDEYVAKGR